MVTFLPYLTFLAFIFLALSINTIVLRYKYQSRIGTSEHKSLEYAARGHANFAEYTPFALILIYAIHTMEGPNYLLHILLSSLVIGRAFHAYCFGIKHNFLMRRMGMLLTFFTYLAAIFTLLYLWIRGQ